MSALEREVWGQISSRSISWRSLCQRLVIAAKLN